MSQTTQDTNHEQDDASDSKEVKERYLNTFLDVKYVKADVNNVRVPSALQIIKRCRNQENSQYYFTIGRKETKVIRDVVKEESPYGHPSIRKEESFKAYCKAKQKEVRLAEKKLRYFEKDNYKSRERRDIRARVYVEEPPDDVRTVADIDPEFYSLIEGRPIEYPFDKTVYMNDVRECTLFTLQAGQREDEVLRIEENFLNEEEKYDEICKRYNEYVDSFEKFLSEDYEESVSMLKAADDLAHTLQKKNEEFETLSVNLGIKKRKVYVLEEEFRHTKMYQDFLYTVSPKSWREKHGITKTMLKVQHSGEEELLKSEGMFDKYQLQSVDGSVPSLTTLIQRFKDDQVHAKEPLLYFTEPKQLMNIFRRIILQNLKSWTHAEKLTDGLVKLKEGMTSVKTQIQKEFSEVTDVIEDLKTDIEQEENKVLSLKEKVNKIISTHFYDAVASEYAMRFHLCVKDVYEKLIVSTVTFSTFLMLKTLQTEYESIITQLDSLDPSVVKEIKQETFVKDRIAMKTAYSASAELKNLDKLRRRLRQDFEPPFQRVGKPIMFKSHWKTHKESENDSQGKKKTALPN